MNSRQCLDQKEYSQNLTTCSYEDRARNTIDQIHSIWRVLACWEMRLTVTPVAGDVIITLWRELEQNGHNDFDLSFKEEGLFLASICLIG
jgi:hypothetical protein